jgi:hypothetical protein
MRTLLLFAALFVAPAANAQTLEDLHWLKGCWRTQGEGAVITEVWSAPPLPAMLGYAYTVRDGELRDWEQTRIEVIDGAPAFIAMPRGGAPVRFRMAASEGARRAAFENPEHDFPKRVEYWREGDRLHARVSAGDEGFEIHYRRITCSGALRP